MAERTPFNEIEAKWQSRWAQDQLYTTDLDHAARPYYNLMEFPYPSGEGLHVGHVLTYCGADAFGRLRAMQGYDVFQPMGFDAFGIHSENYALQTGVHPAELVPANIHRFRDGQMKRLGCQFDWGREVDTTSPSYYRWTQWIFLQLYKAGLAYRAEAPVNWCPQDKTVLANEQVIEGRCERCDTPIERRVMRQWFFRITQYAERLLDFNGLDFTEAVIKRQTAWIGRSEGVEIDFRVVGQGQILSTFTTRPDTIFGATFVLLAPEHPLVLHITSAEQKSTVARYVARAQAKLERERLAGADITSVFTGALARNPANGEHVPIWVADYVLSGYGSGVVMGVPAHDGRDFALAQKYKLPVIRVISPTSPQQAATDQAYEGEGVLCESGEFSGLSSHVARETIAAWLQERGTGRKKVQYRLRDWLISRQRYWGPPIPIVYCANCGEQPVPEGELPVRLPHVTDFRPTGLEASPLAAVQSFVQTACPVCGGSARRETDVSDNFLDSAWYFLRYTSTDQDDRPWDEERIRRWLPVDHYAGGPEHATMHHLYARFIVKALHDMGHLQFEEPFTRLRLHGIITKDGAKMSKSRGNVVSPDAYIQRYGADVFRMYMLFLGPWEEGGDFSDKGISGLARFAGRLWTWVKEGHMALEMDERHSMEAERERHRVIARVTENIEALRFHVAIAALMEHLNWLRGHAGALSEAQWTRSTITMVLLMAPFAPHLAEELWERLGQQYSVHRQAWPEWDAAMLEQEVVELPVQVDGKLRDHVVVPADADEAAIREAALARPKVRQLIGGGEPVQVFVVPGRVVNIVMQS